MSDVAAKLAACRVSLAAIAGAEPGGKRRVPLGHAPADAALGGGLCRGALHEILAEGGHEAAATGFAAALLARVTAGARAAEKPILWIRPDFVAREFGAIAACGLKEWGFDPARLLLLSTEDAAASLRAAADALTCAALGAVMIEVAGHPKSLDMAASRRLTLASDRSGVTVFLLRFGGAPRVSTAETRWSLRAAGSIDRDETGGFPAFDAALLRNRHGRIGRWIMEWCSDDGLFRDSRFRESELALPAHSGAGLPVSFDRPAAAANALADQGERRRIA